MNAVIEPLDALVEARALIAKPYAWIKGKWRGENKHCMCYCALGAVREVYGIDKAGPHSQEDHDACYLTEALLDEATPDGAWDIVSYNDHKDTKKKDILKTFDRAIASLKENA